MRELIYAIAELTRAIKDNTRELENQRRYR